MEQFLLIYLERKLVGLISTTNNLLQEIVGIFYPTSGMLDSLIGCDLGNICAKAKRKICK
jgi:hypothetical protein